MHEMACNFRFLVFFFFIARGHLWHNYAAHLKISDSLHASATEKALPLIGKRTKGSINVGILLKKCCYCHECDGEEVVSFFAQRIFLFLQRMEF